MTRISSIEIHDYRSCSDVEVELSPRMSVLIGPNGSGKTTFLKAILLLKKLTEEGHHPSEPDMPATEHRLNVWFKVKGGRVKLEAKIHAFTNDRNIDVVVSSQQKWYAWDFTGTRKRIRVPLWVILQFYGNRRAGMNRHMYTELLWERGFAFQREISREVPRAALPPLLEIADFLSQIRYYSASQFTNPSTCPVSFEIDGHRRHHAPSGRGSHQRFLIDLFNVYQRKTSGYEQFFSIVGPDGIGLIDKIEFEQIATSSIDYQVRVGGELRKQNRKKSLVIPRFFVGSQYLSPNQLSEGTFKTITLLFYLITEKSTGLLVEEPEVCVHHGLLASIIELIQTYSAEKQIVVSTHSDFVLDQVPPENVFSVSRSPQHGTKVARLTDRMDSQELNALRVYLKEEGNLGEYWRHGGLEDEL